MHNVKGPAYIHDSGIREYRIDGRLHREDGPAIVGTFASYYYLEGRFYVNETFWKQELKRLRKK